MFLLLQGKNLPMCVCVCVCVMFVVRKEHNIDFRLLPEVLSGEEKKGQN